MTDWLIGVIVLGLLPAAIARTRGQDFFVWWVYGVFLFPIALIHSFIVKPGSTGVQEFIAGSSATSQESVRYASPAWPPSFFDPILWLLAIGAGLLLAWGWIRFITP